MRTLQEWMGHRDAETTQRYADYAPRTRDAELVAAAFTRTTAEPVAVWLSGLTVRLRPALLPVWVYPAVGSEPAWGHGVGLGLRLLDSRRPSIAAAE